jgi:hypothetical protein
VGSGAGYGNGDMVELIERATARTRAAAGSRMEFRLGARPAAIGSELSGGGIRHPVRSVAAWAVRLGSDARTSQGVIDLTQRRYMLFDDEYAQLYSDGRVWGGDPGEKLVRWKGFREADPLALRPLDALQAVTSARKGGREQVRGVSCEIFACDVDAQRLFHEWSSQVSTLQMTVGVDGGGYVRRVQVYAEDRTWTIELWDFGLVVEDLDWTRLPTAQAEDSA